MHLFSIPKNIRALLFSATALLLIPPGSASAQAQQQNQPAQQQPGQQQTQPAQQTPESQQPTLTSPPPAVEPPPEAEPARPNPPLQRRQASPVAPAAPAQTAPQQATASGQVPNIIVDIVPHGNRRIPGETIKSRVFTRAGDVYDEAGLQRDFSSLWNTGYFEDLRFEREPTDKGWIINIYVKEKPTIRTLEYHGLNSVTQSDVLERFKTDKVGLSVESQYDPTKVKHAEVVLKQLLAEHGRQFATLRTEVRPIPPAAVAVTFVVKEGPKVKVGRIRFEGNKHVKGRTLRAAMKNTKPIGIPRSIFFENLFSRTFDSTKLQEDAERVRDQFQQKGYFKAVVGTPETKMRDTHGHIPFMRGPGKVVDITLPIEEGNLYRLAGITFSGGKVIKDTKPLRALFAMKDGDIFDIEKMRVGLRNLTKAYGELGYINFTPVPDTKIDDDKKQISIDVNLDEGKQYSVRRIEFTGNTTTRDKVIRRELAVEEGQVYNNRLWELSLLRLNQLQYFNPLKPEEDSESKRNDQEGTVDLTLKVKEKGKNSIGLQGGVSGLAGSFIGINYSTNNFLGLGETLSVEANVGSLERTLMFGFTEPYFLDRPIQTGFTVFNRKYNYNQAQQTAIQLNQQLNVSQDFLNTLQNFSQSSTGFTTSAQYALHRSFKRVGITYSFDTSSVTTFSDASKTLFESLAYRNVSGPNALKGVITSKIIPSFSFSTIDNPQRQHSGHSLFVGGEISGFGGNVAALRPIVEWKQFIPRKTHTIGYRIQGSYITGYRGLVAPPAERFYAGGENDLRGFDTRTVSPYAFLPDVVELPLQNPDGSFVPFDPTNVRRTNHNPALTTSNCVSYCIPIPAYRIAFPGADTNLITNLEYAIPIVGPVTIAAFDDFGLNFVSNGSQLRISNVQVNTLNTSAYGCPVVGPDFTCSGASNIKFTGDLKTISGTNFVPRMSTGIELRVILPVVNAPFRIYYAYNPLALNTLIHTPNQLTRSMFPAGGAGDYTYQLALQSFAPDYRLKEPRKTFRFTVATTF